MNNPFNFGKIKQDIQKEISKLPKEIAIIVKNDSVENINNESFYGDSWKPTEDSSHPTLNDTGALLNAVKKSVVAGSKNGNNNFNLNVINDYGIFHNEGTDKLPKRQFMGESPKQNNKVESMVNKHIIPLFSPKK